MSTTTEALAPCPLCGAEKGYTLCAGSTYRWWSVACAECGQEITEARAKYPPENSPRTPAADAEWNDAGKYAAGLKAERDQLRAEVEAKRERIEELVSELVDVVAEKEALRNALWKACGDDREVVNGYLEAVGYPEAV